MLIFLVFLTISALTIKIHASVDPSICQEYLEVEDQFHCGQLGYPLHYGYKNCMAFTNSTNRDRFDETGKAWIDCTAPCLVDAMKNISKTSSTCSEIQNKAFASHVDCYMSCGFCAMCRANKIALAQTFDLTDFLNLNSIWQVLQISAKCNTIFTCLL
ncbi:unnamed protein product [Caenorhabditis angaria]|uniref:ShKT domain-containing protein n=1 Tax=Caenorhabditis angaria TaxID=860376 RepID=A0A9P1I408_9PELO|nr:unnamed protein product [Caenorhabditis angaria]